MNEYKINGRASGWGFVVLENFSFYTGGLGNSCL